MSFDNYFENENTSENNSVTNRCVGARIAHWTTNSKCQIKRENQKRKMSVYAKNDEVVVKL